MHDVWFYADLDMYPVYLERKNSNHVSLIRTYVKLYDKFNHSAVVLGANIQKSLESEDKKWYKTEILLTLTRGVFCASIQVVRQVLKTAPQPTCLFCGEPICSSFSGSRALG